MQKDKNLHVQPKSYIQRLGGLASLNDHEPPIGIGNGRKRLFIDIPQNMILAGPLPGIVPYVYTFENIPDSEETHYTGVSALMTVTENDTGFVDAVTYSTAAAEGTKLHLWFSDLTKDPDFILEVVDSKRQLTISSTLEPPIPNTTKTYRPNRRICSNPDSLVRKWELVGNSGSALQDPLSGAMLADFGGDSYHFYISFAHHEHED